MTMNRRDFLAGVTAAAGTAAAQKTLKTGGPPAAKRPNLIYVFADMLRQQSCGYNGDPYAKTPNMDRLATQSCNFTQAVSSTPVCSPYRASLMTGKYQSSTGIVINETRLSPEHECIGHALTKGGYQTGYIGKWHMWANQLGHHNLVKNGFVPPGPYRLGFDGYWAAYNFNHIYHHSPYFLNDPVPHIREQYEPDAQTDVAIEFVKQAAKKDDPYALFLSWGPPHTPWNPGNTENAYLEQFRDMTIPLPPNFSPVSDPYADNWAKLPPHYENKVHDLQRVYYSMVANLDYNLGRLLKALDESGQAENTILIFTSDHGEMFGAHGRQEKLIFYEEAARVPFLMRWPAKIAKGSKTDVLLGTPDIMPTLLTMLNLPVPGSVEGMDMSGHALGKGGADHEAAPMMGMGTTAAWTDGTEWRAMRDREYTYAIYKRDGKELLFNNPKDKFQLKNLAEDKSHAATVAHYRDMSVAWRKQANDTFENCTYYERWTEDRNIVMTAKGVKQDLTKLNGITSKWFANGVGEQVVPIPQNTGTV